MNLRDLHYLVSVADLRSFIQASEHCHISQPTLSMQIKKMEDDLGVQIFERTNKKVLPTELGEQIIDAARRILNEVDLIKELAKTSQEPLAGNLRLGGFPTLATYIFPQLVPLINQELPRIRLILVEEKTELLIQQLKSGQLDVALLAVPIADDFLETEALFEDEFMLAVHDAHPFAAYKDINQEDLQGQQLLLLDEGHCMRGQALQVCQRLGAEEHQNVRATGLETLRQMVRAGTGMTFMPKIAVRETDDGICYLPFQTPSSTRTIGLVFRKTSARKGLFSVLSRLIQQAASTSTLPKTATSK